jgi:putative transposase
MEYHRQGHCVYYTQYHIVFPTKYRRKIFNEGVKSYFTIILKRVTGQYPEIHINEVNTDLDHTHLLVTVPPKMAVSDAVRIIKANTATALRQKFPFLNDVYWGVSGIWSDGYFVSTVGINEDVIRRYIQQQGQQDTGQAKLAL